jgi:hypothetical protein
VREPGGLDELGDAGLRAWGERVAGAFAAISPGRFLVAGSDDRLTETAVIDWPGVPVRPVGCLGRRDAYALLDWHGDRGDEGRRRLQEEYLEWRVVCDGSDRVERVELTTELSAYWRVLAAHAPSALLATVAEFAGEPTVAVEAAYGEFDPFAADATADVREEAFAARMLDDGASSPYNSGERAICCMVQPTNTLDAMVALAVAAGVAREVTDPRRGRGRCPTAAEAIALFPNAAQQGRASDPLIAERVGRLAWEGRLIGFDGPPAVYIEGVEHTRLRRPDGRRVPLEWFRFSRGVAPRFQRLTLEVPAEERLAVSDLVDTATGQRLRFGAQVAELVRLVLHLSVSAAGVVEVGECEVVEPAAATDERGYCADVMRAADDFAAAS